jgi:HlyD family secretion protein
VQNPGLLLRPGMSATATIVAVERKDVLKVPNAALRYSPNMVVDTSKVFETAKGGMMIRPAARTQRPAASRQDTKDAPQVWVLRDGKPAAVPVTPGVTDGRHTEVTGTLQAGDAVIVDQSGAAGSDKPGGGSAPPPPPG